jgi:hypothetical protein
MSSGGIGTLSHVSGELFKIMTGVDVVHVSYRGVAPALTDLIGGQVQLTFADLPSSVEHITAGKLRALAVTTATRSDVLWPVMLWRGRYSRSELATVPREPWRCREDLVRLSSAERMVRFPVDPQALAVPQRAP